MDGPCAPLAIHMSPVVDRPPEEVAFVPGVGGTFGWVRLGPEMEPETWEGVEWYDLARPEPTRIADNDLYYYAHRGPA